ncbi:PLD nuclease N-terminal domain-containing protein [Paenibacillus sp. J2TS4]|uniref:PLD nuclease N-terminal domain-containing protein n=1 Tax=Paenibacillus sp. J2TS4 TaxID=2807194 RepID=UPI001AFE0972|nr:PLD nuclease N-terminal domain-containing protein [Paenibacillus sp. J2TS4]GIP35448.1 negative regulatory protein YxlE [Paenibacillus sp. J2TS4]
MMNDFNDVPWGLIAPLLVLYAILLLAAIIHWARTEETNGPKWMWLIIIVCGNILGIVLYFVIGRRND